jgi:antitoxin (DNA-binding transcriptional repressor) of toxin-antitoxin stability system
MKSIDHAMMIGIGDLATHTSKVLRHLRSSGEGVLVTRRYVDVLAAITPATVARHDFEVPVRRLSRNTYEVMDELRRRGEGATVTHRGEPVATISPVGEAAATQFAATLARHSREFMESLREADEDLAEGRAVTVDDDFIDSLPERGRKRGAGTKQRTASELQQAAFRATPRLRAQR